MKPFLALKNVQKTYPDGTQAVRGIDLDIVQGEFVVLLGPSGCGKTTTLRMIAGLEMATGGSISLSQKEITHTPPSQRDIGFVFQFYALYPHMTVRQNIAFPLENTHHSKSEIETTISHVAHGLGITHLLNKHPNQLSGGDQQRVSLARAIVRQPDIYLMDEPLGTLDADHRLELREFIRAQQQRLSVTTIYVTHDQEEALSLADTIVVMESGTIKQIGSPREIYHHPANLFVANFVGSPGMNLITGNISNHPDPIFETEKCTIRICPTTHQGPVTLGIRPEFVIQTKNGLDALISMSEFHGSHRYLHLETKLGPLIMRTNVSKAFEIGEQIQITLAPPHIRLFDAHTGDAIS